MSWKESNGRKWRVVGGTELSWCKAVPGGTGTTVLAVLLSKPPPLPLLHRLQITHPILNAKIHFDPSTATYSYVIPLSPSLQVESFDRPATARIIHDDPSIPPFHSILHHELNTNTWVDSDTDKDVFFCSSYCLDDDKWVLALRLHTSVCDRTSAATILKEMLGIMTTKHEDPIQVISFQPEDDRNKTVIGDDVSLPIEDYIPSGKANKPFWARGADLLGYTFNGLRFSNLEFKDSVSQRSTQVIRFQLTSEETDEILSACMAKGIKLCALFTAAFFIATRSSKSIPDDQFEKYAVVMLVDCRAVLEPVLTDQHCGFYYSAILNTHDVKGGEDLWELAKRTYTSLTNAKNNHKHFTDMADLNFLMCKAIDNPALTPSSSMRTSLISVFEDTPIDSSNQAPNDIGLEDYIGCASVHGVGTSVAIFDSIRNGKLDCTCVYPSPLHSREQMQELINEMVKIMIDSRNCN